MTARLRWPDWSWLGRWVAVPLVAALLLASRVDPAWPPVFARERISAVLLLDGQAYFGVLGDGPLSDSVELREVYYFQDAQSTSTNLPLGLVRRGTEIHRPADGMRIRRDRILAIETVSPDSPVAAAIAMDRTLRASVR